MRLLTAAFQITHTLPTVHIQTFILTCSTSQLLPCISCAPLALHMTRQAQVPNKEASVSSCQTLYMGGLLIIALCPYR